MKFLDDLSNTPVLISAGTGGVGKTTMSCALAILLAQQNDARVLVITIDPAKRLASVLSEQELGHVPQNIDHGRFITEKRSRGEVFAAMVDTQRGWEDLVNRYAKDPKDATRIFNNSLYANLTTRFSHSHDFIAMDQLFEHYRSGDYDYIVLDTPPASKAFGFFDAPQAMSDFFGGKLVKLITSPYRLGRGRAAKLFDLASQPFFALADKILGKQFINDVGEFFFLFHSMYDDIVDRASNITELLTSQKVHSTLILNPQQYISKSFESMSQGLKTRGIALDYLIINNVPFLEKDLAEIKRALEAESDQERLDSVIDELIHTDCLVSEKIYSTLEPSNAKQDHKMTLSAPRAYEQDEHNRLKELISSVQTAG